MLTDISSSSSSGNADFANAGSAQAAARDEMIDKTRGVGNNKSRKGRLVEDSVSSAIIFQTSTSNVIDLLTSTPYYDSNDDEAGDSVEHYLSDVSGVGEEAGNADNDVQLLSTTDIITSIDSNQ